MKVLLVNTFHYRRGGDCTYAFALADLLRDHGHEVRFFAMQHPENVPCADERYFVPEIDFQAAHRSRRPADVVRVLARSIHSPEARDRLARLLDEVRPDIAHLQNLHAHITPSIVFELAERGIPTVWTLHDYKWICPNTHLLSHGAVCESCKGGRFYRCTLRRCKKESASASLVASLEAYVHRAQRVRDKVGIFLAPSRFLLEKFVEFGWPRTHLRHLRNFLPASPAPTPPAADRGYALYLGQLEPWKGVGTLLTAWRSLGDRPLVIAGDGSARAALERHAREQGGTAVRFAGRLAGRELATTLAECSFVCVPSTWYENCPYSVLEAMRAGKPVVASRIGGLPELVADGDSGLLVAPGDAAGLADAARALFDDPAARARLGRRARERAESDFGPAAHYRGLMQVYGALQGAAAGAA